MKKRVGQARKGMVGHVLVMSPTRTVERRTDMAQQRERKGGGGTMYILAIQTRQNDVILIRSTWYCKAP